MKHDIAVLIVTSYQEGSYAGCSRNAGGTEKHKIKDLDFVATPSWERTDEREKRDEGRVTGEERDNGEGIGGQTRASSAEMLRSNTTPFSRHFSTNFASLQSLTHSLSTL